MGPACTDAYPPPWLCVPARRCGGCRSAVQCYATIGALHRRDWAQTAADEPPVVSSAGWGSRPEQPLAEPFASRTEVTQTSCRSCTGTADDPTAASGVQLFLGGSKRKARASQMNAMTSIIAFMQRSIGLGLPADTPLGEAIKRFGKRCAHG